MESRKYQVIDEIFATHCCVCNRHLTDAKSMELGIGPVCRSRYLNYPEVLLDEDAWAHAFGHLAASNLPTEIRNAVIGAHPNAHAATNILVYYASAHYDDKEIVLSAARMIHHLGYTSLSQKLRSDRSYVQIQDEDANTLRVTLSGNQWAMSKMREAGARKVYRDP